MRVFSRLVGESLFVAPLPGWQQFLIDFARLITDFTLIVRRVRFDVQARYRRTMLGPLWMTIAVVVYATGYSFLVGFLFGADIETIIPYVVTGALVWQYVAGTLNGSPSALISRTSAITNGRTNFLEYVFRANLQGLVQLAHGLPIVVIVLLLFGIPVQNLLVGLVFLPLTAITLFFIGVPLALLATRFRDIVQITQSLVQFMFYMTPIIWRLEMLPERARIIPLANPLFHLVDIVRGPILGDPIRPLTVAVVLGLMIVSAAVAWLSYAGLHHRTASSL
jgi:homopolymeric O-antigen transport system permease protein